MSTGHPTSDGGDEVRPPQTTANPGAGGDSGREVGEHDLPFDALQDLLNEGGAAGDDGAEAGEAEARWDADDERRRKDCFAPPQVPCECYCLHCRRTFDSDRIWFQRVVGDPQGMDGFWMCPTPNCGGAGFTFDIFPTDPDHPANEGWYEDDGDGDEEEGEDEDGDEGDDLFAAVVPEDEEEGGAGAEWDPDEPKYKELDDLFGDDDGPDGDIEGEEWKYGLAPGERPAEPSRAEAARREQQAEEEKKYDEPDRRPRFLDWSNREDRTNMRPRADEDDIPF